MSVAYKDGDRIRNAWQCNQRQQFKRTFFIPELFPSEILKLHNEGDTMQTWEIKLNLYNLLYLFICKPGFFHIGYSYRVLL